jgi:hypothetical protein
MRKATTKVVFFYTSESILLKRSGFYHQDFGEKPSFSNKKWHVAYLLLEGSHTYHHYIIGLYPSKSDH